MPIDLSLLPHTDPLARGANADPLADTPTRRLQLKGKSLAQQQAVLSPHHQSFDLQQKSRAPQHASNADGAAMHALADHGTRGAGGRLPHLDRIQESFGRFDISGIQAYTGSAAAQATSAMGARAFASGHKVAFGGDADLHTAAHEAAHVVQQRHGVHLKAGLGQAGDVYERHADAVADAVVRGESAEPLLAEFGAGGGGASVQAVQLKEVEPSASGAGGAKGGETMGFDVDVAGSLATVDDIDLVALQDAARNPLNAEDAATAAAKTSGYRLRIDWIRKMEAHLRLDRQSTSGNGDIDATTAQSVARFQRRTGLPVTGVVDPETRRRLEEQYTDLQTPMLGEQLEAGRVLVPGDAGQQERYVYYKGIIEGNGGVFHEGRVNILAMRGVHIRQVGGGIELSQNDGAQRQAEAMKAGQGSDHFSGHGSAAAKKPASADGYNDVVISLYVEDKVPVVRERLGTVDPSAVFKYGRRNTGHMRDGQYVFRLGDHGTPIEKHKRRKRHAAAVQENYAGRKSSVIDVKRKGGKRRYTALELMRSVEVWREGGGKANDLLATSEEYDASNERIIDNDFDHTDADSIKTNIHTSSDQGASSEGCQVVPVGAGYEDLIEEVQTYNQGTQPYTEVVKGKRTKNKRPTPKTKTTHQKGTVLYTLIDASKVGSLTVSEQRDISE